jgi:hypothetical protein
VIKFVSDLQVDGFLQVLIFLNQQNDCHDITEKLLKVALNNHKPNLPTKFRFIWPSGFRGEEFKKSANQKQESPVAAMFLDGSGRNEQSLQRAFHVCFLLSFGSFGQAVSEEKIFFNRPIRNKNCLWRPYL